MNAFLSRILQGLTVCLLLAACGPQPGTAPAAHTGAPHAHATLPPTPAVTLTATRAPATATATQRPAWTPVPTRTAQPGVTPTATPPLPPLAYIGTPVPLDAEPIGAGNVARLTRVAQWGRGTILGVAFAPDGSTFVAGSAHGLAVYDAQHLDRAPAWIPFEPPVQYTALAFSTDGRYLHLEIRGSATQIRRFADGQVVPYPSGATWIKAPERMAHAGSLVSPDNTKRFTASLVYGDREISLREVYEQASGQLLYQLPDETTYVLYDDWHEPEGCDLKAFSYCGNAYDPSTMTPYRASFSPTGVTLSVLYRTSNLYNSNEFSTLRIYAAADGTLLARIGSFARPVETFAYAPDGSTLLVGYVDGTVQLWDLARLQVTFEAWHFNPPIVDMAYTSGGRYLLLQTRGWLQIRRAHDGLLLARYANTAFAVSPTADLVAIGTADGRLQALDLAAVRVVQDIQAHTGKIYALAFSPDGQMLTSSAADCDVRGWRVRTGEFLRLFEENTTDAYGLGDTASRIFVHYLQFIPGTNQLLGFGSWARVVSWDVNSGATQYFVEPGALEYYQGMMTLNPHFPGSFGVDEQNGRFYIDAMGYDLRTGAEAGEYQPPAGLPAACSPAGATALDGSLLITRGYDANAGRLCVLDAHDLHLLRTLDVVSGAGVEIGWPYLSPGGRQLAVATEGGVVYVYQAGRDGTP